MHVKRIHEMIEKLTECAKSEMDSGMANVDTAEMGAVVDMIKDLCCAEKDAKITKAMEEAEEEEKKSDEYLLHMLKEEYGEDEGKRYYDNYRYANGRFAPKGRGTYRPRSSSRRGYEEMPYLHMMEESPEWYRDMDRMPMGRMYYSGGTGGDSSSGGQSSGGSSSGASGTSSGSSGGSSMGYSESMRGYSDGQSRGYDEGYSRGYREGRSSGSRNRNESRSERARRGYEESKNNHSSNSAEDKQSKMASLEEYMKELSGDLTDMVKDMTPEERTLMKNKINVLATKI